MQKHNTAAECCWSQQNIFLASLTDEGEQKAICQINYLESIHENNPSDRYVTESYIETSCVAFFQTCCLNGVKICWQLKPKWNENKTTVGSDRSRDSGLWVSRWKWELQ